MAGIRYERSPQQVRRGYQLVRVQVAALDAGLARDPGYHVGPGGVGPSSIKGRYAQARTFLAKARAEGSGVHPPEGGIDRQGRPFLDDGRHRFAAIRDSGAETVDIAVPRGQASRFARLFGGPGAENGAGPLNQKLAGLVEPEAPSWRKATAEDRRALYEYAGEVAVRKKRAELARAIGSNGRRMKARKHPRGDGANGPVMTPHDAASRTSRLLDARATSSGVTLFWHAGLRKGQKRPWGSILAFHAAGAGHLPVRDVRLSKRGIGAVRREVAAWWDLRAREKARRERARAKQERENEAPKTARASKKPGLLGRAQKALVAKYSSLRDYLRPKGKGF